MSPFAQSLTVICAVASGTVSGAFFPWSTFAMKGLKRLPPAQGAAAMQSLNKEAPTPPFMLQLFGTGAAIVVLMVYAALNLADEASVYQLVGGGVYILGVLVVTGTYHVPRNNKLDGLDPDSAEGRDYWTIYHREWVRMNHVRTIAPLVTSILLTVSLVVA